MDGRPVAASNGVGLNVDGELAAAETCDTVVICSGIDVHVINARSLTSWLRKADRRGADIGAICTGSYVLAKAGLLDNYRCTIHWENLAGFCEDFPDIEVTRSDEHTSELQSLMRISYAVFCLKKKNQIQ